MVQYNVTVYHNCFAFIIQRYANDYDHNYNNDSPYHHRDINDLYRA